MAEQLSFDRSLYLPEAVEAAVAAYADYATVAVTKSEEGSVASLSPLGGHDAGMLAHAFCNHVLHETIARLRQSALREIA